MKWTEIITPERIRCRVACENKREAILLLCDVIAKDLGIDPAQVREVITAREKLGATTIGKGVLLPHAISDAVSQPTGALMSLQPALKCTAPDDVNVDLVIGVLMPPDAKGVPLLAKLMQPLRQETTLQALRSAATPQQAWAVLDRV
jgi:nitrogen PTS system EIIA component